MRLFVISLFFAVTTGLTAQQPASGSDLPAEPQPHLLVTSTSSQSDSSSSQQQQPTPAAQQANQQTPQQEDTRTEAQRELEQQKQQRMLGVVPNFNTVINGRAAPLNSGQKFNLWVHSSTDPFVFVLTGLDAAYSQATNQFPGYGQGLKGYGKRYGAALADTLNGNLWGNAILPSVLHQDPRYFRLGHGTITHRILYAAATTVICRGDNGKWQPNYSNVAGNFIGGAMSNIYYPPSDRGFGLTIQRASVVTAEGALGSLAVEFYPDVAGWWRNRHNKSAQAKLATAP